MKEMSQRTTMADVSGDRGRQMMMTMQGLETVRPLAFVFFFNHFLLYFTFTN